jgi:hypothetical protein
MDKERKIVERTELPDTTARREEGEKVFVVVDINYHKNMRVRGYYFSAIIWREKPTTSYDGKPDIQESWILTQRSKTYLLLETKRFNEKILAGLTLTPEQLATVKAEAIASIH